MKRRHKFVLCVAVVFLVGYYLLSSTADMLEPDSHETHEPSLMNREGAALTKPVDDSDVVVLERGGKFRSAVHIFYYQWYANPEHDPELGWNHWNHRILPHWDAAIKQRYPYDVNYQPPADLGCSYFPLRGAYSSSDPKIIDEHMKELQDYVVVISWWGQAHLLNSRDGEGNPTDRLTPDLLRSAEKYGARIAFHHEPYEGRTALSVLSDLKYIHEKYGGLEGLYTTSHLTDSKRNNLPVIYMYDSYHISPQDWRNILTEDGDDTIRYKPYDALVFALCLEERDIEVIAAAGFDGVYTYFGSDGFTQGSTLSRWPSIVKKAKAKGLLVSISVGPGYDDVRIRPWNAGNTKHREKGAYYDKSWDAAMRAGPDFISVTSYNEWMEGTQIEAAVPKQLQTTIYDHSAYKYEDYLPLQPNYYITKTWEWAEKFLQSRYTL